jgi:hypothetical protein
MFIFRRPSMFRKVLLAGFIAVSFGSLPVASFARPIVVEVAPPAPRQEAVPGPRRGQVWVPGHYEYRHRQYVWVGGHWMRERRGYGYNAPRWVERDGRWVMEPGRWVRGGVRDRDGDGVPNRMDNHPNNPNRN